MEFLPFGLPNTLYYGWVLYSIIASGGLIYKYIVYPNFLDKPKMEKVKNE